jgi:hypothetical protein
VDGETIGFEGWSMRVRLDEETLKAIANKTNAEYFYAGTASDLKKVYDALSSKLTVEKKETEISALFALVAAVLSLLSAGLSLLWFNRILCERRHQAAFGARVAVLVAQVVAHVGAHALGRFAGLVELDQRAGGGVRDALGHQRLLRVEVVVEGPVREAGGFHDLADAHAEAALLEQARGLVEDLLVLFGGFRCGVSHVTSTCSGVLQELA